MFDEGLDEQLQRWHQRQKRYLSQVLLSALFFGVVVWFFWGYRDVLSYSFSDEVEPTMMGDVVFVMAVTLMI